jgi:hypothetical protein
LIELVTQLFNTVTVVVDHARDPNAYTGDFELIYSQEMPKQENFADLTIVGKKIKSIYQGNGSAGNRQTIDVKMNTKTIEAYQKITDRYVYLKHV